MTDITPQIRVSPMAATPYTNPKRSPSVREEINWSST
jgi:hypothetical protein